jgi:hypothetical protein
MGRSAAALILGLTLVTAICSVGQSWAGAGHGLRQTSKKNAAPDCWVELEFASDATAPDMAAFDRRVRGLSGVARTGFITRRQHIDRIVRELKEEGVGGERFQILQARAGQWAGAVLLVTPRDARAVDEILERLEELPASVTSSAETDACHT